MPVVPWLRMLLSVAATAPFMTLIACEGGRVAIKVDERDFTISTSRSTAVSGETSIVVHNDGPSDHEFVILRTELPEDGLPVRDVEWVDEEAAGIEVVAEFDHVLSGRTKTLRTVLTPGAYVLICNVQGHYLRGMHTSLLVGDPSQ